MRAMCERGVRDPWELQDGDVDMEGADKRKGKDASAQENEEGPKNGADGAAAEAGDKADKGAAADGTGGGGGGGGAAAGSEQFLLHGDDLEGDELAVKTGQLDVMLEYLWQARLNTRMPHMHVVRARRDTLRRSRGSRGGHGSESGLPGAAPLRGMHMAARAALAAAAACRAAKRGSRSASAARAARGYKGVTCCSCCTPRSLVPVHAARWHCGAACMRARAAAVPQTSTRLHARACGRGAVDWRPSACMHMHACARAAAVPQTSALAAACARVQVHGVDFYSGADGELSVEVYKSVKERLKRTAPDVEFRCMRTHKPLSGALVDERKRALYTPPTHACAACRPCALPICWRWKMHAPTCMYHMHAQHAAPARTPSAGAPGWRLPLLRESGTTV
jgi:hypothetical protein